MNVTHPAQSPDFSNASVPASWPMAVAELRRVAALPAREVEAPLTGLVAYDDAGSRAVA